MIGTPNRGTGRASAPSSLFGWVPIAGNGGYRSLPSAGRGPAAEFDGGAPDAEIRSGRCAAQSADLR